MGCVSVCPIERAQIRAEREAGIAKPMTFPSFISDNMVLQHGVKAPLWGWAAPGEKVTVQVPEIGSRISAKADASGRWQAQIGPLAPGGPYSLVIQAGSEQKTIRNVLVGEVWLCSGQSNMEMLVGPEGFSPGVLDVEKEIAEANYPAIRMFAVAKQVAGKPQTNCQGEWTECSTSTVARFSAVGYFFGREIHQTLKMPVGLINAPWGGMPAQSFLSREAMLGDPELAELVLNSDKQVAQYPTLLEQYLADTAQWLQESQKADAEGKPAPPPPVMPPDPRSAPIRPAGPYNAMIHPLIPYAMRGVIWYQGETNAMGPAKYYRIFPALISDWRTQWKQGDFPFLYVQLANYDATGGWTKEYSWAIIREAQLKTLSLPNTGMAVAIDIGEPKNIHPRNKQEVGRRLALAARAIAYGEKIPFSGPIYQSMQAEAGKIRLRFAHAEGGLLGKAADGSLSASNELKQFTIAGADKKFHPARAKIESDSVLVWSDAVPNPVAARYGWLNNPEGCNLYNKAGLPASPFRTDDWVEEGMPNFKAKQ